MALTGSRRASRSVLFFHEGLAATAQAGLFLLLGILVFPSALVGDLGVGLVVAATLTFVARPIAVGMVLAPLGTPIRETAVVSWAGLRGAAPIVLATIPFTAGHPDGALVFDVAFVVVVVSVAVQAPSLGLVARRLGVVDDRPDTVRPEIVPVDLLDADLVEVSIPGDPPTAATTQMGGAVALRDRPPPGGDRVVVIHRDDDDIGPTVTPASTRVTRCS
ncbi:MAG: cation:proton antiporter [Ilumatobacteraceae bacterium]